MDILGEMDIVGITIAWLVAVIFIGLLIVSLLMVGVISIEVPDELQATPAMMTAKDRKISATRIL